MPRTSSAGTPTCRTTRRCRASTSTPDGSVWYTQLSNTNQAQLNWVRAQPNKTPDVQTENKDYMKLTYFGHGTNTALEEDGADRYLWAGAYGVCNAKGQYWNEKLVGRVKYVKGATVKTNGVQRLLLHRRLHRPAPLDRRGERPADDQLRRQQKIRPTGVSSSTS